MHCAVNRTKVFKKSVGLFCFVACLVTAVLNKILLSMYLFPSYLWLRLMQMILTLVVLCIGQKTHLIHLPQLDINIASRVWPIPLISLGVMATSQNYSLDLDLPFSMMWRPIAAILTLALENTILGIKVSRATTFSVFLMFGGSIIASAETDDAIFWVDYIFILLNNVHLAAYGVFFKKILDTNVGGAIGLLYIETLVMVIPVSIVILSSEALDELAMYTFWGDPFLLGHIVMFIIMGVIQSCGLILCTQMNSALATSVIECTICSFRYLISDINYVSWIKFVEMTVTVTGSLLYLYL